LVDYFQFMLQTYFLEICLIVVINFISLNKSQLIFSVAEEGDIIFLLLWRNLYQGLLYFYDFSAGRWICVVTCGKF